MGCWDCLVFGGGVVDFWFFWFFSIKTKRYVLHEQKTRQALLSQTLRTPLDTWLRFILFSLAELNIYESKSFLKHTFLLSYKLKVIKVAFIKRFKTLYLSKSSVNYHQSLFFFLSIDYDLYIADSIFLIKVWTTKVIPLVVITMVDSSHSEVNISLLCYD